MFGTKYGVPGPGNLFPIAGCFLLLAIPHGDSQLDADELLYPLSVAAHPSGTLYLADRNLPGIWQLAGQQLTLYFKGSQQLRTPLHAVRCVAVDSEGRLLAGDSATRDIYRFNQQGQPQPLTDLGQGFGQIGVPMDIAIDAEGNLFVSDLEIHRIVKVPSEGGRVDQFASIPAPRGLFYDSRKRLWVISGRRLIRLSPAGEAETVVDDGVFSFPHTVAVDEDDVAYVCDGYTQTIWRISPGKQPESWVRGDPFVNPVGIDIHEGKLLVVDPRAKAVFQIDADGNVTWRTPKPAGQ
jgi:sugar lactone lactonase YvrE